MSKGADWSMVADAPVPAGGDGGGGGGGANEAGVGAANASNGVTSVEAALTGWSPEGGRASGSAPGDEVPYVPVSPSRLREDPAASDGDDADEVEVDDSSDAPAGRLPSGSNPQLWHHSQWGSTTVLHSGHTGWPLTTDSFRPLVQNAGLCHRRRAAGRTGLTERFLGAAGRVPDPVGSCQTPPVPIGGPSRPSPGRPAAAGCRLPMPTDPDD
jgi:hypothetical protein